MFRIKSNYEILYYNMAWGYDLTKNQSNNIIRYIIDYLLLTYCQVVFIISV